jgi:hypothetical protein
MNQDPPTPRETPVELASRILLRRIQGVQAALIEVRRLRFLAWVLGAAVVATSVLWFALASSLEVDPWMRAGIHLAIVAIALIGWWVAGLKRWSALDIARRVEAARPGLDMGLITAIEKLEESREPPSYLTEKLLDQTVLSAAGFDWTAATTQRPRRHVTIALGFIIAALLVTEIGLLREMWPTTPVVETATESTQEAAVAGVPWQVEITPGDAEVEKGSRVVFEALFSGEVPSSATLVLEPTTPESEPVRLPMQSGIEEGLFGAVLPELAEETRYHVESDTHRSKDFLLSVFEYPKLVQSDLTITPPEYTGDPPRKIEKARKATVLEGSSVRLDLTVNKPLAAAELFGNDESIVPLTPNPSNPTQLAATIAPSKSMKYRVHLVDDADRGNRNPPWIELKVRPNSLPKIEVVFPKRDLQVSPIQELPLEAKVSDELSVQRSGLVYTIGGQSDEMLFDHAPTAPRKPESVQTVLKLEDKKAEPRQLISYYFWAEDEGPGGEVRRAMSDMFFAEVRHFEDIFREAESPPSEPGQPQGEADKLVDLQKEIVNATWRIIRDVAAGQKVEDKVGDVGVVAESQEIALSQVKEAMEESDDPEISQALSNAWKSMRDALDPLEQARDEAKRSPLNQALEFEQAALEWLQRAQSREHQVARQNQPQQGGGSQKPQQQQINALELKQEEQRYEEERQASPEATAEQRENLQVLARLKELARRQEALAKKMRELEEQMREAESEEQQEELASQLKQLQEEQEQLLRDLDDLGQQMDEATDPSKMAEARDALDQTREQVVDAAQELQQQQLADASQSATRAQRQLQEMEEDFRERTSNQFSEDARRLKEQARQLAEQQEQIHEALESQRSAQPQERGDMSEELERMLSNGDVTEALENQQEELADLLEGLRTLSEQSEVSEPLLSRKTYEAVREAQTEGIEEYLEDARYQTRFGRRSDALDSERRVANAMQELSKDVAEAAETVLGSEAESLRMARAELDQLIEDAEQEARELAAGEVSQPPTGRETEVASPGTPPSDSEPQPSEGSASGDLAEAKGREPGKEGEAKGSPSESKGSKSGSKAGTKSSPKGTAKASSKGGESKGGPSGSGSEPTSPQPTPAGDLAANSPATGDGSGGSGERSNNSPSQGGGFFFDAPTEQEPTTPITGNGYGEWSDRLRTVSELLGEPSLRNDAARILDDARQMRVESRRNNEPPQVGHLESRITQPLAELRDRVIEELARQSADDPTVPIDRDPVPPEYREMVRRYYTELGRGQ